MTFGLNRRRVVEATRTWTFSPLLQPTGFQPVVVESVVAAVGRAGQPALSQQLLALVHCFRRVESVPEWLYPILPGGDDPVEAGRKKGG